MAGKTMYTTDMRISQQTDLTNTVIEAQRWQTPLLSDLQRSSLTGVKSGKDWTRQVEVEPADEAGGSVVAEGTDWDSKTDVNTNVFMDMAGEEVRSKGWRVTRESIHLNNGRIPEGTVPKKKEQDLRSFELLINAIVSSDQEAVKRASADQKWFTRGIGSWLDIAQHDEPYTVPDALRPADEFKKAADITQDELEELMAKACLKARMPLKLTGYVGLRLKQLIKGFVCHVPLRESFNATLRRNRDATDRGIVEIVDFLEFDSGRAEMLLCPNLFPTAAGDGLFTPNALSDNCGMFLDMSKFGLEWLLPITHEDMSKLDTGGGPRGYHDAIFRTVCHGAQGSFRIIKTGA